MKKNNKKNLKRIILTTLSIVFIFVCFFLILFSFNNGTDVSARTIPKFADFKFEPNHIVIPKVGINEKVYNDNAQGLVSDTMLNRGPSYYDQSTDEPGKGNCVLAGHSAVTAEHSAPFAKVNEKDLALGDEIILTDKDNKIYKYKIDEIKIVSSTDLSVVKPTDSAKVTLITCIAPNYPRDKRLIVVGSLK